MYVTRIAAKQFKCFESIDIELSKLTLLTGANSSGKSSLLYAFLVPFQSQGFPLYLSPNGRYVNMGDFNEMVHCNRKKEVLELDFTIQDEPQKAEPQKQVDLKKGVEFKTSWILDPRSSLPRLKDLYAQEIFFDISIKKSAADSGYILNLNVKPDVQGLREQQEKDQNITEALAKALADLAGKLRPNDSKQPDWGDLAQIFGLRNIHDQRFASLEKVRAQLTSFYVSKLLDTFNILGDQLNFVGSFRLEPERTYYQRAKVEGKVGRCGENHIDQIVEWERRKTPEFSGLVDSLKRLELVTGLKTRHMRGGRFQVEVKTDRGGLWVSLPDVGFGTSQFLPIAVADFQLPKGSTLAVAQPEIHLHPKGQANFGNYLVERIRTQNKHYIVETHSEYLINRIRLLIAKGHIEPTEVGTYYFQRSGSRTKVNRITFTKSGKIEGAPQDFFDTYMMDVMDIAMQAK